jgi:hypothetical protein
VRVQAADLPVPAAQANQAAADAAKSPLPDSESSDDEGAPPQAAQATTQEAPAAGLPRFVLTKSVVLGSGSLRPNLPLGVDKALALPVVQMQQHQ